MEKEVKVEFIEGNRKNKLAQVEGHLFEKNKTISLGVSYRCLKYKTCPSKLHVMECGSYLKAEHNHAPCPEKIQARKIIQQGKTIAKQSLLTTNAAILDHVETQAASLNLDASFLGSSNNLKRTFRRTRFKEHGHANIGNTLEDLAVPATLQSTFRNNRFLMYDNNGKENRMLIFASADALDKLSYCQTWLIDGTFKSCPGMFDQIYTIHGVHRNIVAVPFVYAYLPGKSQHCYAEFFRQVRRHVDGEPQHIISDFELAAINACQDQFIATQMRGCLFHVTQSIHRKVQSIPVVLKRYMTYDDDGTKVRTAIRSIGALAFVRPAEVPAAFMELRGQFPVGDSVREIFSYFQENYMGYTWDDVRFPIPFWNVRERFANLVPRTNNAKEGWHFRFNNMHSKSHPTVQHSIEMIRKEENHWHHECQKLMGGIVQSRRKKSIQIDSRLRQIIAAEEAQVYLTTLDFLKSIQQCLHDFLQE